MVLAKPKLQVRFPAKADNDKMCNLNAPQAALDKRLPNVYNASTMNQEMEMCCSAVRMCFSINAS